MEELTAYHDVKEPFPILLGLIRHEPSKLFKYHVGTLIGCKKRSMTSVIISLSTLKKKNHSLTIDTIAVQLCGIFLPEKLGSR